MTGTLRAGETIDIGSLDAHRRELTGYCYRMLGAAGEAEDAVQETMVRAWRRADAFEGRSSARSWLYRIATNVCIDMLRSPQRRCRPIDLGPASTVATAVLRERPDHHWVEPMLDSRVIDVADDPADVAAARESVRLAFVAALQWLPPRQRAVLILRDVLRWSAAETAELLDTSVAAANSSLQRARDRVASAQEDRLDQVGTSHHDELVARYVDAFERYDMEALVKLLRDDAVMTMPPYDLWLTGAGEVVDWMTGPGAACRGSRLVPLEANGSAAFAAYKPAGTGDVRTAWAIQVIDVRGGRIAGHHNFIGPAHFERFGLPVELEADEHQPR